MKSPKTSSVKRAVQDAHGAPQDAHGAPRTAGFTLIEVLVITALFTMIASLSMAIGLDAIGRATVHGERDLFVSLLASARARALSNTHTSSHGVHITSDTFILFEGTSYNPASPTNQEVGRSSSANITGPDTVIFEQLTAHATAGVGTITISDEAQTATIDINSIGRIDW